MADETNGVVRYTNAWLIDVDGRPHQGDFILHPNGDWSRSIGDEDVEFQVSGEGRLITRTFQNWHTHLAMVLNRSMGEGLPLMQWLEQSIFPTEKGLTPEFVEIGTRAAVAELIATGTSFACDMYYHPEVVGQVLVETGLRGIVCGPITDGLTPNFEPGSGDALRHVERLVRAGSDAPNRVEYGIATHAVYTCPEETLKKAADVANATGCTLSIHTSETRQEVADCHEKHGMYPIEYLDSIGYFQEGTVCAHCGWVTKREMRILAEHEAHAVHCPVSNQKLATGGTMSYPAMMEAGVDVRLGTDGAASNNALDMRAEMKAASLIQRHDHWDATLLDPIETYELGVRDSKDWVTWDLNDIRMRPIGRDGRRLLANLIYSNANCLDMWVDGQPLRREGVTLSLNESEAFEQLEEAVRTYYSHV
ncbi:MAG TPA: amidohydrolase family protein [Candidatus Thalassarchaeaceae archaeon]|nr:amidohydrolase family protein [Candidatus Thalassarchaeaceae archaeon]|tara:strand:- start:1562 stop:2824 length:1263 start_codon:yes stop_codon:yes gene_type:complete